MPVVHFRSNVLKIFVTILTVFVRYDILYRTISDKEYKAMEPRELFICDDEQNEANLKNKRAQSKANKPLTEQKAIERKKALETMRELHKMLSESDN